MKLILKKSSSVKLKSRLKKKIRVRKKVFGTTERPRLSVFRSGRHIYAQIIDDSRGHTVAATSTIDLKTEKAGSKAAAKIVGSEIAKIAAGQKVFTVVFDRNGLLYHGRVQSLAEGAREGGLVF